jgi:hypothetical protein
MHDSHTDTFGLTGTLHTFQSDLKLALAALLVVSLFITVRGVLLTARGRSQAWR